MAPVFISNFDIQELGFEKTILKKGEFFVQSNAATRRVGIISQGIMRGYVTNTDGEETNLLFFHEKELVAGNMVPEYPSPITIQCLEECHVWVTGFNRLMEIVRSRSDLQSYYDAHIDQVHSKIQTRLTTLINYTALEKYRYFLKEHPNLINRIPHYQIASYLGITPTQLSRIRKEFVKRNP